MPPSPCALSYLTELNGATSAGQRPLLARLWQATTRAQDFDAYWAFLQRRALPDYQAAAGNHGVQLFRRLDAGRAHFVALSYWSSLPAIVAYAGGGIDAGKYYPEHANYLVDHAPAIAHYEMIEPEPAHALPPVAPCACSVHAHATRRATVGG